MEENKETPKPEAVRKAAPETAKPEPKPQPKQDSKAKASGKVAAMLIRNTTEASGQIRDTLRMLRLTKKLACVVVDNRPEYIGMLKKVKDYVTFGEVDDATVKELTEKRGSKDSEGKLKPVFHLHPPRGGFERKGIKHAFTQGGALGYRGAKMNDLIKKML